MWTEPKPFWLNSAAPYARYRCSLQSKALSHAALMVTAALVDSGSHPIFWDAAVADYFQVHLSAGVSITSQRDAVRLAM